MNGNAEPTGGSSGPAPSDASSLGSIHAAPPARPAAIVADALVRRYDEHVAVDGVSFTVAPGQVLGLLGPNGAGKTTLLRMLAGVLVPTSGHATILGHDVQRAPLAAKARLGFISGETALYGRLSVKETLTYFGELSGLEARHLDVRIREVAATFGLEDLLDRRAESLSTGQRQRANLARAFVADPPVLILDEPTSGLDVISGRFVHDAIRRAKAADKAVLLSTHVMTEASELCDVIALLVRGRIRGFGTEAELLASSGQRSLSELIIHLHEVHA
ncbi:ATP-binding cassette domain-containing protein [Myxococcota bacterium]|nr:ATP-binding cassette domain-containing protein [Myxococcota bacterium]